MSRQRGFTLIEMITAIVITGIVAGIVAVFIARPVEGYIATSARADLTDAADLALKRIALEIRTAVPNSVVAVTGGGTRIEFIPARAGGRYCSEFDTGCDALSFTTAGDTFDILGPTVGIASGDQVVVFNTGQSGLNAYNNDNRRSISRAWNGATLLTLGTSEQAASRIELNNTALPYASPSHRFQIAPGSGPVMFMCAGNQLRRYDNYGYDHDETTGTGISNALVISASSLTCSFRYEAVNATNGIVSLRLTLANAAGESITLLHQIHVDNMP